MLFDATNMTPHGNGPGVNLLRVMWAQRTASIPCGGRRSPGAPARRSLERALVRGSAEETGGYSI